MLSLLGPLCKLDTHFFLKAFYCQRPGSCAGKYINVVYVYVYKYGHKTEGHTV